MLGKEWPRGWAKIGVLVRPRIRPADKAFLRNKPRSGTPDRHVHVAAVNPIAGGGCQSGVDAGATIER